MSARVTKKKGKPSRKQVARKTAKKSVSKKTDHWPRDRDVLFRPERYKYVRKVIQPDGCVFCDAANSAVSFEKLCLFKTEHSMIVLNKYPYNSGHLLVLPKRHCGDLMKLSAEEYQDLHLVLKAAVTACMEIYKPAGFNLGMNHGAISGAGIPDHLHYHLVPRWAGDLNFFPLIAKTKVVIESLEQSYSRYAEYFKSI